MIWFTRAHLDLDFDDDDDDSIALGSNLGYLTSKYFSGESKTS